VVVKMGEIVTRDAGASCGINTLNEKNLHACLKEWYARPGDRFEVDVDGFLIDVLRPGRGRARDLLIEIQTKSLGSLKRKLLKLCDSHRVRLVYPIPSEKWVVRMDRDGETVLGRRRSPKRGSIFDLFQELVSIPGLMTRRGFSLEVLLVREEEVRRPDRNGGCWRRKGWTIHERRLVDVVDRALFRTPRDLAALLPLGVSEPFTTADLAEGIGHPRWLAQKMAYCLREMGAIRAVGKKGNAILYGR
jgi:hypothetical protein